MKMNDCVEENKEGGGGGFVGSKIKCQNCYLVAKKMIEY